VEHNKKKGRPLYLQSFLPFPPKPRD